MVNEFHQRTNHSREFEFGLWTKQLLDRLYLPPSELQITRVFFLRNQKKQPGGFDSCDVLWVCPTQIMSLFVADTIGITSARFFGLLRRHRYQIIIIIIIIIIIKNKQRLNTMIKLNKFK